MGFQEYFEERADLSERLATDGFALEGSLIATTALDSLAAIWSSDFPTEQQALDRTAGGRVAPSVRLAEFVRRFAPRDPDAVKVAVVAFAQDWKRLGPQPHAAADRLLARRVEGRHGTLPHAHLDVPLDELIVECPEVAANPKIERLAIEYTYPSQVYRFVRCAVVHGSARSRRTHGFTRGEEVMYMELHPDVVSIGFGVGLLTRWLRATVRGYVAACTAAGVRPANNFDPTADAEEFFANKWSRV